ncbi:IS1249 family transposase [Microbacterium laevaniformans]|uniref:IS1249 family transposase n=1 Tax=Microbacterium laevaniformans TaxID=36807 RepID=A0A4S2CW35_9MICO|nr:IS1249 family transposase [Microbacterium laevaniformans]
MDLPSNQGSCVVCGSKLVKNGRHPSGTQRWRCRSCGSSSIRRRPDVTRREQLHRFLTWLMGKASQAELAGSRSARSFRRDTAWCWALEPRLPVTGEVHDVILVDGIWIETWCLLIALTTNNTVVGWQWAARESTAAWGALFETIPAPMVVVTDGGSGIRSALALHWPTTTIQRCIFHLQLNVTRELTRNPRLRAGKDLRQIALTLSNVHTVDDAITWRLTLEAWWKTYGHMLRERTLYDNGHFGYTHKPLRRAWAILHRVTENEHAFTFVRHDAPRTTSRLEGLNSQIRHLLRHHRGMPIQHQRRAVEWFLLLHEVPIDHAHRYAHAPTPQPPHEDPAVDLENPTPALYDTALDPTEGLWLRTGWAGHA